MKKFYDTCALLNAGERAFAEHFYISMVTLRELENIKTSRNKDAEVKHKARKVTRLLNGHPEMYTVANYATVIPSTSIALHDGSPDYLICYDAAQTRAAEPIVFVTDDLSCRCIARGLYHMEVASSDVEDDIYTGYVQFAGTSDEINQYMEQLDTATLFPNQYLLLTDTETGKTSEMRFDGEKFVELRLPHSGYLKGKNSLQRCALDLLMNRDIGIVAILGTYGSGKSFLTTQMGLYHVLEKGNQSKLLGIREPAGEGAPVGYLKGTLEDKTRNFFLPIEQQLKGGEFELEALRQRGQLDTNIPYYMKGTTYNDTIMLVDEAEDLSEAQIRLVGTRLGQNSRIFLSGDYGQSLVDRTANNPLVKMCNELRGEKSFGCIYLDEDVRSSASKLFAELFK